MMQRTNDIGEVSRAEGGPQGQLAPITKSFPMTALFGCGIVAKPGGLFCRMGIHQCRHPHSMAREWRSCQGFGIL